jgi:hypothetical protein
MATLLTVRSETKYLDTWNGSSNDAPPTDWETVAFDDSGWNTVTAVPTTSGPNNQRLAPGAFTFMNPPSDIEALWPSTTPSNQEQGALFRWHWTFDAAEVQVGLSPGLVAYTFYVHCSGGFSSFSGPGDEVTGLRVYVNGTEATTTSWQNNTSNAARQLWAAMTVPGDNLFAAGVFGTPHHQAPFANNTAWIGFKLEVTEVTPGGGWVSVIG